MRKYIPFFYILVILLLNGCITHKDIPNNRINRDTLPNEKEREHSTVVTKKPKDSLQLQLLQINSSLRKLRGHIEVLEKKYQDQNQKIETLLTTLEQKRREKEMVSSKEQQELSEKNNEDFFTQAEVSFQKNNWKSAIIYYEKYREQKGKVDPLYKKATFQIGLCFKELKMENEAKVFFREIINSYPQSPEAKQAKEFLSEKKP